MGGGVGGGGGGVSGGCFCLGGGGGGGDWETRKGWGVDSSPRLVEQYMIELQGVLKNKKWKKKRVVKKKKSNALNLRESRELKAQVGKAVVGAGVFEACGL